MLTSLRLCVFFAHFTKNKRYDSLKTNQFFFYQTYIFDNKLQTCKQTFLQQKKTIHIYYITYKNKIDPCDNATQNPFYYECSNGVCAFIFELCDGVENCLDGGDESDELCATNPPSNIPTLVPSKMPSNDPTNSPSNDPTNMPSNEPSSEPSGFPTNDPTRSPTNEPSVNPTQSPVSADTDEPTSDPTNKPTRVPRTWWRVQLPTPEPTTRPTIWWSNYRGGTSSRG